MASRSLPALGRRPEARAEAVEDLVRFTREGRVRVPEFQRGLKWNAQQVLDLFDSIYRGYPIGSLLLFRRRAPAARVHLGPILIDGPEIADAMWVVDGQQRLTALAASMLRPEPMPSTPVDPFVVYFDPKESRFLAPTREGHMPATAVPVNLLIDATRLSEWIFTWPHAQDGEFRSAVFEASKRIREYRVPMYVLDSDEADLLREIFFRINSSGKKLEWSEVYDALYGHDGPIPSSISQLAVELGGLGMGTLRHEDLTSCLLAIRGLDVTRTLAEHRRRDPDVLRGAVADALPVLRQVLSFLRSQAAVVHLRLLPRAFVVEVLARFFVLHPEPGSRTLDLLTRWVWRVFLGEGMYDERSLRRRSVADLQADDEEASVQALLALAPKQRVEPSWADTFDARAARSRLVLLALASLAPRELSDGRPIDVASLMESSGAEAFRVIVPARGRVTKEVRSPANRMIHAGAGSARAALVQRIRAKGTGDIVVASHGISAAGAQALVSDQPGVFVERRKDVIIATLMDLGDRLGGWSRGDRDRPSISYLVRKAKAGSS